MAVALTSPTAARAQVTTYSSLATYLAAVTNPGTDDYTGFNTSSQSPSPINRTAGTYSYSASVSTTTFYGAGVGGNPALSTNTATDAVTFSGFSSTVRGIGGNFFGSNISGEYNLGDIQIDWTVTGSGSGSTLLTGATTSTFFGVVSSSAFTSFKVTSVQPSEGGFLWPTIDNFVLGESPRTTVPEPPAYALLAAGMLAIGAVSRRRRAV